MPYITIVDWCIKHNLSTDKAKDMGGYATKLCKYHRIPLEMYPVYGLPYRKVNKYPEEILDKIFVNLIPKPDLLVEESMATVRIHREEPIKEDKESLDIFKDSDKTIEKFKENYHIQHLRANEYICDKVTMDEDDTTICPNCGGINLHVEDCVRTDDDYGGYAISMWCEGCSADIVLGVWTRKGTTYLKMFYAPQGRDSELRRTRWGTDVVFGNK